jgi:hypothetical protein
MPERKMSIENFIKQLKEEPEKISFPQTMAMVDENYEFFPVAFSNAELYNKAGENNGSCKIFYFGQLHQLSKQQTLNCFGEYYQEVLRNPEGEGHREHQKFYNFWLERN